MLLYKKWNPAWNVTTGVEYLAAKETKKNSIVLVFRCVAQEKPVSLELIENYQVKHEELNSDWLTFAICRIREMAGWIKVAGENVSRWWP